MYLNDDFCRLVIYLEIKNTFTALFLIMALELLRNK